MMMILLLFIGDFSIVCLSVVNDALPFELMLILVFISSCYWNFSLSRND
jgi:hypothetical protein